MPNDQLNSKIAAKLVEYQEEFSRLSFMDKQWVINNPKEAAALFVEVVSSRKTVRAHCEVSRVFKKRELTIKPLDGKRYLDTYGSMKISFGTGTRNLLASILPGQAATPRTEIWVHENAKMETIKNLFYSIPGKWGEKFFTQDQIIEISEKLSYCFKEKGETAFLIKLYETSVIDENRPEANFVVIFARLHQNNLQFEWEELSRYFLRPRKTLWLITPKPKATKI